MAEEQTPRRSANQETKNPWYKNLWTVAATATVAVVAVGSFGGIFSGLFGGNSKPAPKADTGNVTLEVGQGGINHGQNVLIGIPQTQTVPVSGITAAAQRALANEINKKEDTAYALDVRNPVSVSPSTVDLEFAALTQAAINANPSGQVTIAVFNSDGSKASPTPTESTELASDIQKSSLQVELLTPSGDEQSPSSASPSSSDSGGTTQTPPPSGPSTSAVTFEVSTLASGDIPSDARTATFSQTNPPVIIADDAAGSQQMVNTLGKDAPNAGIAIMTDGAPASPEQINQAVHAAQEALKVFPGIHEVVIFQAAGPAPVPIPQTALPHGITTTPGGMVILTNSR